MIYKIYNYGICIPALLMLLGCSQVSEEDPYLNAHITGQITVDAELDTTRDYSGIELKILLPDTSGQLSDTLFYAVTDVDGQYAGDVRFPKNNIYSLTVSRRSNTLGVVNLVLADRDTVQFNAELPDLDETAAIESVENDLYSTFERLQSGVNRVIQFANAGHVSEDTLAMELRKWSDMFWEFYEENTQSFAGQQSAATSVRLLEGWEDDLMMQRLRKIIENDQNLIPFASRIGTRYFADEYDLDHAVSFIDSLVVNSANDRIRMELKMDKIKLLYDSARVETARMELDHFKENYLDFREAYVWVDRFEYDLSSLAPGSELPGFELISLEGDTINRDNMIGTAYMLEFTRLDNFLYQQQFDRTIAIYHIYKNYGVDFITIPLEATNPMLNGFFEERARLWPVAQPGSFDPEALYEDFNLNTLPTRILVDRNGTVVRKYEGTEFNDIVRGLQIVLTDNTEEETS